MTDTPIKLVIIILSLTAYHTSNKGITTISKISLIYTLIIIILFIMATIGLIPEIELDNLKTSTRVWNKKSYYCRDDI